MHELRLCLKKIDSFFHDFRLKFYMKFRQPYVCFMCPTKLTSRVFCEEQRVLYKLIVFAISTITISKLYKNLYNGI
jgi:hypothetical protein